MNKSKCAIKHTPKKHFDDYFILISSIHSPSAKQSTSNKLYLPRVTSSSAKCSLTFFVQKCGLLYQAPLSLLLPSPSKGNLRNTHYMNKINTSCLHIISFQE